MSDVETEIERTAGGREPVKIENVVLIEPGAPGLHVFSKFKLPRLGLPLLGAILREHFGITPKIYFEEVSKLPKEEMERADLVGISTITPTAPAAYDLIRWIKRNRDIPVVLGGPHVSFLADEALAHGADFVIRGEGEESLVELIEVLREGGDLSVVKGLSYMENGVARHNPDRDRVDDLNTLPWPDLTLIEGFGKARTTPVMTSRGCPFDCKFCTVTTMFGRRYRFRETEDIINELRVLTERNPKTVIFFYDDNFTASPKRTKELLTRMKEEGITPRWTAQARVDVVDDPELMQLMKDTNCLFLYLGLESINPDTLQAYRKSQTVEDIVRAVEVIHDYGIRVHGMFVLGSDEDDRSTIRQTVTFAKKTGIDTVQFMVLTPIPGSETYNELRRDNRIFIEDWSKFNGHNAVFYPMKMPPYMLQKEASLRAMFKFYSLWSCWKLGLLFRWRDMAYHIYAHRLLVKWRSRNRGFLAELKARYKAEMERKQSA